MRARHLIERPQVVRKRQAIEAVLLPSARELFPMLRDRLLASRPVVGTRAVFPKGSESRRTLVAETQPILGAPTFRNRIDENGEHV